MKTFSKARPCLQQLAHLEPGEGILTCPESGIREPKFKPTWFKSWCLGHGVCQADIVLAGGEPAQGDSVPRPLPLCVPTQPSCGAGRNPSPTDVFGLRAVAGIFPDWQYLLGVEEDDPIYRWEMTCNYIVLGSGD